MWYNPPFITTYVLAVVLVDPLLVTSGDPIQVWEAEVEGGQRWCEPLVFRLVVLWSRGSNIIIIDVKMLRQPCRVPSKRIN